MHYTTYSTSVLGEAQLTLVNHNIELGDSLLSTVAGQSSTYFVLLNRKPCYKLLFLTVIRAKSYNLLFLFLNIVQFQNANITANVYSALFKSYNFN